MNNNEMLETSETIYKIETTDNRQMLLYLNAERMMLALEDILMWYREICNGKDYGYKILYKNKEYDLDNWVMNMKNIVDADDLDKNGQLKSGVIKEIYTGKYIENKLYEYLEDIKDFINQYIGY